MVAGDGEDHPGTAQVLGDDGCDRSGRLTECDHRDIGIAQTWRQEWAECASGMLEVGETTGGPAGPGDAHDAGGTKPDDASPSRTLPASAASDPLASRRPRSSRLCTTSNAVGSSIARDSSGTTSTLTS